MMTRVLFCSTFFLCLLLSIGDLKAEYLDPANSASIEGQVVDAESDKPIPSVVVEIPAAGRWAQTDVNGAFTFERLKPGEYGLVVSRVGYRATQMVLALEAGDTASLTVTLDPTPETLPSIRVRGVRDDQAEAVGQRPIDLADHNLRESLGQTISETLAHEPGVSQRTMGPSPARPVLRGLGGNRLLITQDGQGVGDLSATAADHAVAVDPISTSRIEVIRGPAALMSGSNAIAGVVNVKRDAVPILQPSQFRMSLTAQSKTVNEGIAGGLKIDAPFGPAALHLDLNGRSSQNLSTPQDFLENSGMRSSTSTVGGSLFLGPIRGGISYSRYESRYGIPGGFLGGHKNGVDVQMEKEQVESRTQVDLGSGAVQELSIFTNYNRYYHQELESNGACGVSFGVLTYEGEARLRLQVSEQSKTLVGVKGQYRDYAQGCLSFVQPTIEEALAGYVYHEQMLDRWRLEGIVRFDYRNLEPDVPDSLGDYMTKAGHIRGRRFSGMTGGVSVSRMLRADLELTATMLFTRNIPATEELYSDGPHLAAFSYEVGNADLSQETGIGLDIGALYHTSHHFVSTSVFTNRFYNYVFPRNTGQIEYGPGEDGFLVRYQYDGQDAVMYGVEGAFELALVPRIAVGGNVSYVYVQLLDDDIPAPFIPPLNADIWVAYRVPGHSLQLDLHAAAAQDRVSEFEEPTAGYAVFDVTTQHDIISGNLLHSLVFGVENVLDTEYRKHLSRVKSVMPEPGIGVKVLYRLSM